MTRRVDLCVCIQLFTCFVLCVCETGERAVGLHTSTQYDCTMAEVVQQWYLYSLLDDI